MRNRIADTVISRALALCIGLFFLAGCSGNGRSDGYGNFESTEVIVSSEASGKLLYFGVHEGDRLARGTVAAKVDTLQLHLEWLRLEAERKAVAEKRNEVAAEAGIYLQQRRNLQHDIERYRRLLKAGAVAPRQLEDLENQARVLERQAGSVASRNPGITGQQGSLDARIAQIRDQILKATVRNPVDGTVLVTYAEQGELAAYGKALYKIANLDAMYLRAYLSGSQLSRLAVGDEVDVLFDGAKPASGLLRGRVTWISPKAEFTPKIIQTREDRVSMVYAVKVLVSNPGGVLKIGMPGEIRFRKP